MIRQGTIAALAASLCACTTPALERGDECIGTCDTSKIIDIGRIPAPDVATCRIEPDDRMLVCELTSESLETVTFSGVALTIETNARNAPIGTVLRAGQPRFQRLLGEFEHTVNIEARFLVDTDASTAVAAKDIGEVRAQLQLGAEFVHGALSPPIELWRLEVLGHGLDAEIVFHSPITGDALPPLATPPGARHVLDVVNHADGLPLDVTLLRAETAVDVELEAPAIFALTGDGLRPAQVDQIPTATSGSVAIQCMHVNEAVRCEVQDLPKGTIGKVPIEVFTADGAHHRFTISERFPAQLPLPDVQMPVVVRADIEIRGDVVGLPLDSRVVRVEAPLDTDSTIGLALPFELWETTITSNAELTTIIVEPYTLEFGRSMQRWFQYEANNEQIAVPFDSQTHSFVVAAPPGTNSLPALVKSLDLSRIDHVALVPDGHIVIDVDELLL